MFYQTPPNPVQKDLYEKSATKRGFAATSFLSAEKETELFESVFMLGLSEVLDLFSQHKKMPDMYFFVPPAREAWATQEFQKASKKIFATCKALVKQDQQRGIELAKMMGDACRHILLGSKIQTTSGPPGRWVAFGFEDDAPKWLLNNLITFKPFDCDD